LALTASATKPRFLVNTGDNFYWCGIQNTSDYLIQTDLIDPYSSQSLQMKWYSTLGNHEYGYNVSAQVDYMQLNKNWIMPSRYYRERIKLDNALYMSLIVLDSSPCVSEYRGSDPGLYDPCGSEYPTCSLSDGDDDFQGTCEFHKNIISQDCNLQYLWFQDTLSTWVPDEDWLVVVGHHPIDELNMRDFATLLEEHGFSIYLNGHVHTLNQYTIDGTGAYVTTGAGSMVPTTDQQQPITKAKLMGRNITSSVLTSGGQHTYETVYNNAVAGFTSHTFSSDYSKLFTQYITYTGEVVHSFTVNRKGKIVD